MQVRLSKVPLLFQMSEFYSNSYFIRTVDFTEIKCLQRSQYLTVFSFHLKRSGCLEAKKHEAVSLVSLLRK